MATSQNSKEEYRKTSRKLKEVQLELEDLRKRQEEIASKHTKDIFSDASLDKATYNERLKLLDAELTSRLEVDPEYQATRKRERELRLEENDLKVNKSLIENEIFGSGLPPDLNDIGLDDL